VAQLKKAQLPGLVFAVVTRRLAIVLVVVLEVVLVVVLLMEQHNLITDA
jgi:hypothetical protein